MLNIETESQKKTQMIYTIDRTRLPVCRNFRLPHRPVTTVTFSSYRSTHEPLFTSLSSLLPWPQLRLGFPPLLLSWPHALCLICVFPIRFTLIQVNTSDSAGWELFFEGRFGGWGRGYNGR